MVVEKQWFPVGSRFTIPDEDAMFVREFHQWLTGRQMTTEPTNCADELEDLLHRLELHWEEGDTTYTGGSVC